MKKIDYSSILDDDEIKTCEIAKKILYEAYEQMRGNGVFACDEDYSSPFEFLEYGIGTFIQTLESMKHFGDVNKGHGTETKKSAKRDG